MTGVILCGGESSRMGTDKGMLQFQEQSWAQRAAQHFISLSTIQLGRQGFKGAGFRFPPASSNNQPSQS